MWNLIYHNKKERRGIIIMLLVLLVALFVRYLYLRNIGPPPSQYADLQKEITFVDITPEERKSFYNDKKTDYPKKGKKAVQRFVFDPNTISGDSLTLLGVPAYIGKNLENYRKKGGKFRSVDDFRRIYGIEKYMDDIEDLIKIPPQPAKPKNSQKTKPWEKSKDKPAEIPKPKPVPKVVELNTADSIDLIDLRGIGPFYAKTILELRRKLGGFTSIHQITEAYGVPDTIISVIGEHLLKVDTSNQLRKINLNNADFKTLIRHPYFDKKVTNAILKYRKAHNSYKAVSDLRKIHLIPEELFAKIEPYVTIKE